MWNNDYRDMLCALRDADVDFILIGAYALAANGFPRATLDIDPPSLYRRTVMNLP